MPIWTIGPVQAVIEDVPPPPAFDVRVITNLSTVIRKRNKPNKTVEILVDKGATVKVEKP